MIVGLLEVDLAILDARSLKDKRQVIRSLKQRLRNKFNVSVAEVDHHDVHKRCLLGVAMVATESRAMHSQFDLIVEAVRHSGGATLVNYERTFF